jgi:uncharacterized protein YqjF (DUF2071 family)
VAAELIRPLVPAPLRLQEHDGLAWIGVVPFRMEGVMRRPLPDLPWVSAFPEINVRTYVEHEGKAGVWFLSLDATNPLAVWGARSWFDLPYHQAAIAIEPAHGGSFTYAHRRRSGAVAFDATYGPLEPVRMAVPGTLEHFLTERYCFYSRRPDGALFRVDVHHEPWPLQRAHATFRTNTMLAPYDLALEGPPLSLLFAQRVDVVAWSPERVA